MATAGPTLAFLIDEDVDVHAIAVLRGRGHTVREVRSVFGEQSRDSENMVLAREAGEILVTCDRRYYLGKRKDPKRCAILLLKDLHERQVDRVIALVDVIEQEAGHAGPRFFMWIGVEEFLVQR